jgi:hypothetical protein
VRVGDAANGTSGTHGAYASGPMSLISRMGPIRDRGTALLDSKNRSIQHGAPRHVILLDRKSNKTPIYRKH